MKSIAAIGLCLVASFGCDRGPEPPKTAPSAAPASAAAGESAAAACIPATDLPAQPRKVRDRQTDISDLRNAPTQAGVAIFDVAILPSGAVTNVRLVSDTHERHPWSTIVATAGGLRFQIGATSRRS